MKSMKRTKSIFFLLILGLFGIQSGLAQKNDALRSAREGDRAYDQEEHEKALEYYEKAMEEGLDDPKLRFNKGNSLFQLEKFADAASEFERIARSEAEKELRGDAFHNLGNSHLISGKLDKSIEAYKQALRIDPSDEESRYNLALAKKMKEEQEKKDQEDQEQEDNEDNEDNENQEDQEDQDQKDEQQDDGEDESEGQDEEEDDEKEEEEGSKGNEEGDEEDEEEKEQEEGEKGQDKEGDRKEEKEQEGRLSPQEVKRLLEAMEADEKQIIKKILKNKEPEDGKSRDVEKDW